MTNIIIFSFSFLLLILSTFIIVDFPFILFFFKNIPNSLNIIYENSFFIFGTYSTNIQLPIMIFISLILPLQSNILFFFIYFYIGIIYGLNIFYAGGGFEYINTDSYFYIISSIPILLILSLLSRLKNRAYLFKTRYIIVLSLLSLFLIHIISLIFLILKYGTSNYYNLFISYFLIPIFSQSILTIILSIISIYFNKIKYYFLFKYINYRISVLDNMVKN